MSGFRAAVTTGIYCRPEGCVGRRARPENVRRFELAAAAEAAGYRACLRCRPYRLAQPLPSIGPRLVCDAVRLIVVGMLDRGTEADLAAAVGTSARHLRRLFAAHLGVTPVVLARSRRTHFARRLLDDTDLTVTDVAFASGFGSLRQFNRACQEVFRATPRELRARRRRTDRLVADGGLPLRLPYDVPLDWPAVLVELAANAIPGLETVRDETYRRTILVDGAPGVVELRAGGPDDLLLVAHLPRWRDLIHIVHRVRRIAGMDRMLARTDVDATDVDATDVDALGLPGWDRFESDVVRVVHRHAPMPIAREHLAGLVQRFGQAVPGLAQFGIGYTFPTADRLATADLARVGLDQAAAAEIRRLARR